MAYNSLPGVLVNTVDGGLVSQRQPTAHSVLILGTAAQGTADQPYQVTDRAKAQLEFGLQGNLIRSMEEAAAYSDNIVLYRIGTQPMTLAGVGTDTTTGSQTPGFTLEFGHRTTTATTDYKVWYKTGVLVVYFGQAIVYSNDPAAAIDTGDITVVGTVAGNNGLALGTGGSYSLANAIPVQAAGVLAGSANQPAPVLTPAVTGLGLTGRQTYIAFLEAADLLQGYQAEELVVPSATLDAPNVAFYVSSDATTVLHNPVTNPDALDWLRTTSDAYGTRTYQWASDVVDSNGGTVSAMVASTPAARLAAGFHEVNWGYALASFAASVSTLDNVCISIIGTSAPRTLKLVDIRQWIGFLPTYNAAGQVIAGGRGLLGNPYLAGIDSAHLNPLCADYTQGYRAAGFTQTAEGQYDGTTQVDRNGNVIDIGAYLHVFADQMILTNNYATSYLVNGAAFTAGFLSSLDEKIGLTYQQIPVARQVPALVYTPQQLNDLSQVNINVMQRVSNSNRPYFLHDNTAARSSSDFTNLVRQRVKGLAVSSLLSIGRSFLGGGSTGGLQLTALQTALENALLELQKRGYLTKPTVTISSTQAETLAGKIELNLTFRPVDELRQINAFVGFVQ